MARNGGANNFAIMIISDGNRMVSPKFITRRTSTPNTLLERVISSVASDANIGNREQKRYVKNVTMAMISGLLDFYVRCLGSAARRRRSCRFEGFNRSRRRGYGVWIGIVLAICATLNAISGTSLGTQYKAA